MSYQLLTDQDMMAYSASVSKRWLGAMTVLEMLMFSARFLRVNVVRRGDTILYSSKLLDGGNELLSEWNPLEDDTQALWLAADADLKIEINKDRIEIPREHVIVKIGDGDSKAACLRRAIVEAAALISRSDARGIIETRKILKKAT